ncbi:MAG: tRNA (guanosine(46)-N7)-methyltransferase TrmB [Alphaproteobacteria bacterium]|nr:tRNA (guanosine(46)-N7)-methyltransferase TrmB [Alphaproteobacteria bacterium]
MQIQTTKTFAIKTFARRVGKGLSNKKKDALSYLLPRFLIDPKNLTKNAGNAQRIILEIGIGMSEHFIHQASINRGDYYIGAEPYLNGIAQALELASMAPNNIGPNNIGLWPDSADAILQGAKHNSLDIVYLLFPDPWPKQKQKKRRFATLERMKQIKDILKNNGSLIIASDIPEYFAYIKENAKKAGLIEVARCENTPHEGYITTRFHAKAIEEGREALFSIFNKIDYLPLGLLSKGLGA